MKKALVVGLGGIGKNVYVPQFERQGYKVDTVDINPILNATYKTVQDLPEEAHYDMAVICLPNIHHLSAMLVVSDFCKTILIEKPGFLNAKIWKRNLAKSSLKDHKIVLVKNNLYRDQKIIQKLREMCDQDIVSAVEIEWMNRDRIPNPGNWFTNKKDAFGGVTHDLFPHLYCFMYALFPLQQITDLTPTVFKQQRWNLDNIGTSTEYGKINMDGTYDVCDYAEAHYMIPASTHTETEIPVTLKASWKEGYDKQRITIHYVDGAKWEWDFGLCPDNAYGNMIKGTEDNSFMGMKNDWLNRNNLIEKRVDEWIHEQLEYLQ